MRCSFGILAPRSIKLRVRQRLWDDGKNGRIDERGRKGTNVDGVRTLQKKLSVYMYDVKSATESNVDGDGFKTLQERLSVYICDVKSTTESKIDGVRNCRRDLAFTCTT